MNDAPFTVALDGPAAAGKGTLARALAARFGLAHLDTGLLYRAVGAKARDLADPFSTEDAIAAASTLSDADLSRRDLRTGAAGEAASIVAAIPQVRATLLDYQRAFARRIGGAVLDGRDIGTVVCPDADVKIFVTASDETRARRRQAELPGATFEEVLADLRRRDARDAGRADAPMKAAEDALLLDTTELTIERAIAEAADLIRRKREG